MLNEIKYRGCKIMNINKVELTYKIKNYLTK